MKCYISTLQTPDIALVLMWVETTMKKFGSKFKRSVVSPLYFIYLQLRKRLMEVQETAKKMSSVYKK